jgi:preprotein translocase subunit YajC
VLVDIAYAAESGAMVGRDLLSFLFLFAPLSVIFYFFIFRPQQKQRKEFQEMLASLKKGDRIVTRGGLRGTVDKVEEKTLRLDVGNNLRLWMERDYVDRILKD